MKAISIRQPWAWLIVAGHKDIENRTWAITYRGPILIHAAKMVDKNAILPVEIEIPDGLPRGGIVGRANLVDCVRGYSSPWFIGPYGLVMTEPAQVDFIPYLGMPGIFEYTGQTPVLLSS